MMPFNRLLSRFVREPAESPLPKGVRVYAVGDIHGRLDLLTSLLDAIAQDAGDYDGRRVIICMGDYVDRGADSKGVIDRLLAGVPGFEARYLKGNHDRVLIDFLQDARVYRAWRPFGAAETLLSYGVRPPLFDDDQSFEAARQALAAAMPPDHLAFLTGLEPMVTMGRFVFVHAGLRPGVPLERQTEDDLLFIRDDFLGHRGGFDGRIVVHGHTPQTRAERVGARIGVDTGAYATGLLACAVLEGRDERFIQVRSTWA